MGPAEFQERLVRHFSELRDARASAQQSTPLFVIEHGLGHDELALLAKLIRTQISAVRDKAFGLLWVVYATEIGYGFAGDEYWQTFQEQTPGWAFEHRPWLKARFKEFHRTYGGFEPSGPWADHFSTICWPIAHSLLPRDLQRHLARLLYEIRYDLTGRLLGDAQALGELIAANAWNASSRFHQLTEQPLLLGQIASALLHHGEMATNSTIYEPTLLRIRQDLERESIARSWMQSARAAVAKQSTSFGRPAGHRESDDNDTAHRSEGGALHKRISSPRLEARHDSGLWQLYIHVPDLSALTQQVKAAAEALAQSRCILNGRVRRPLARGSVLAGAQIVRMEMPFEAGRALLALEAPNPEVDALLRHFVFIESPALRLFKLDSPNGGFENRGGVLRPGSNYLIVSNKELASPILSRGESGVPTLYAYQLNVPTAPPREFEQAVTALELRIARTAEVWPAVQTAAYWDGQGQASWLSTDRIVIGVRTNFSVEGIALTLGGQGLNIEPKAVGEACFVELGRLDSGRYQLNIRPYGPGVGLQLENSVLNFEVRPPEVWRGSRSSRSALFVQADPPVPSLEDFWGGESAVEIWCPAARNCDVSLELYEKGEQAPRVTRPVSVALPVSSHDWRDKVVAALRRDRNAAEWYDQASRGVVRISAADAGNARLDLDRENRALRWATRRDGDAMVLRLVDEDDRDRNLRVLEYTFQEPDIARTHEVPPLRQKGTAFPKGGLVYFEAEDVTGGIVAAPVAHDLGDLNLSVRLCNHDRTPAELTGLLQLADRWASARVTGHLLASTFRLKVVAALQQEIFRLVGGARWHAAERRVIDGGNLDELVGLVGAKHELWTAIVVQRDAHQMALCTSQEVVARLTEVLRPFSTAPPEQSLRHLAECSLRLASNPSGAVRWLRLRGDWAASALLTQPLVARVCRLAVLAIDRHRSAQPWDWR